jgi:ubiquinone/menaquinone biosynthesis C-methylase UbiE
MMANTVPTKRQKGYKGMAMEGLIARWYAQITGKDIDEIRALAGKTAKQLAGASRVLEIAPGPGYLAIELAGSGNYQVTGLDISETFVDIAQRKAREANVQIDFRQGDAAYMPFESNTFDFAVCRAAFKNFSEPVRALTETYRILKPGGKALIIDLRRDASRDAIDAYVNKMGLNPIFAFITKATFRQMLLKRAYTEDEFRAFIAQTGFKKVDIQRDLIGLEVWLEK